MAWPCFGLPVTILKQKVKDSGYNILRKSYGFPILQMQAVVRKVKDIKDQRPLLLKCETEENSNV